MISQFGCNCRWILKLSTHLKDTTFDNLALDIETLNQATLKGKYDICAISFALYPVVKNDFTLLKTAVSFGDGYGPKVIKRKGKRLEGTGY